MSSVVAPRTRSGMSTGWSELLEVPENATWPRFMTAPHPDAVGSYGAECVAWLITEGGITPRWWQDLVLVRQLGARRRRRAVLAGGAAGNLTPVR